MDVKSTKIMLQKIIIEEKNTLNFRIKLDNKLKNLCSQTKQFIKENYKIIIIKIILQILILEKNYINKHLTDTNLY